METSFEDLAPRARENGLVVREVDGEFVVFDRERNKALYLNGVAAAVWKRCDGATRVADISALVSQEVGVTVDEHGINRMLAQLGNDNLLQEDVVDPRTISRRQMMIKAGITAAAVIPVISALSVPSGTAFADTCLHQGSACTATGTPCCGNNGGRAGCCYLAAGSPGVCGICSMGCCQVNSSCGSPTQVCSG